jgi:lipoyl-dependent peroxiredoxin
MASQSRQTYSHEAYALWSGEFASGEGSFELGSGAMRGLFDRDSRFQQGLAATPEELLGAAQASCFSMTLANLLEENGYHVHWIRTRVVVNVRRPDVGQPSIEFTEMYTEADVRGIDVTSFRKYAAIASKTSVLSRALSSTSIRLDSELATPHGADGSRDSNHSSSQ